MGFRHMPDASYGRLIYACKNAKTLSDGRWVQEQVIRSGLQRDIFLGNHVIAMFGKCGSLEHARKVFDELPERNVFSWTVLIAAYIQHAQSKEAVHLFGQMQLQGVVPNRVTFATVLGAFSSPEMLTEGKLIHARVVEKGFELDIVVHNAVVKMYTECWSLEDARRTFDKMQERDLFSWATIIAAYAQHGYGEMAYQLYHQMQLEGKMPNQITFVTVLTNVCCDPVALPKGKIIHAHIIHSGFDSNVLVGTAIVNMYGKCASMKDAWRMFHKMPERNVFSWNSMIGACTRNGHRKEALQLYRTMHLEGMEPDKATFATILNACPGAAFLPEGRIIHADILERGFESDVVIGTAIINLYGKCGNLEDARSLFDKLAGRNIISWNTMIAAYAQHSHAKEALQLFQEMNWEGMIPDKVTFSAILDACASLAALEQGKRIHEHVVERGYESDVVVGTAIINMYGKCGSLQDARQLFERMSNRDAVAWNVMIATYAQHGYGNDALQLFRLMQLEDVMPNKITFVSILSACSHSGLVDEGYRYFASMITDFGVVPTTDHCVCMIDLLGRAGRLDEAEEFINRMFFQPQAIGWMTLLGACKIHGDVELGKRAAEHVLDVEPQNAAVYVALSNVYAAVGMWDDVEDVRKLMLERDVKKEPGCSSIEVGSHVHEFSARERLHPQIEEILTELKRLNAQIKEEGYVPDTKLVLHDVAEDQREYLICQHSEKLAIAFGLINTAPGTTLRIIKNLRVCDDCHTVTKFISKIVGREIVVRDINRYHHFRNGFCSCGDYW